MCSVLHYIHSWALSSVILRLNISGNICSILLTERTRMLWFTFNFDVFKNFLPSVYFLYNFHWLIFLHFFKVLCKLYFPFPLSVVLWTFSITKPEGVFTLLSNSTRIWEFICYYCEILFVPVLNTTQIKHLLFHQKMLTTPPSHQGISLRLLVSGLLLL